MSASPVVTGISPKEGPPGTRVTIRGEFLGTKPSDLVGLLICGCDCLLSAEWKSRNKIVARSGPGKGRGDIIVRTASGGQGTSTVQFRGYHETIGPLKESAVWVEEAPVQNLGWGSALSSSSIHIEDPLGLSVEANEKKVPEDDLLELFPDCNGELGSEQFSAGWFLLEHHHSTSFDDLRVGLAYLRRKVHTHKEGHLSFLKGNVGSVMEQLETLENLKNIFEKDVADFGIDRTKKIEDSLYKCRNEGSLLFEGVLSGREKADRTRNALGLLHRFKFLFTLPASIERNLANEEYDTIINDYARINNLFGKTDLNLFKKVLAEVNVKINDLKEVLWTKLRTMPNSIENQKKIIRNLVQLDGDSDPGWEAILVHTKFLESELSQCYAYHMSGETQQTSDTAKNQSKHKRNPSATHDLQSLSDHRVECVEELCQTVGLRLGHISALGQTYFNGELHAKPAQTRIALFKKVVVDCVKRLEELVSGLLWVGGGAPLLAPWLPHCLRHLRYLASHLRTFDIPQEALDIVAALIQQLRVECVKAGLRNVCEEVKGLGAKENWALEYHNTYGTITQLPKMFERLMTECASGLKESVVARGQHERALFESETVSSQVIQLIHLAFNAFLQCLEKVGGESRDSGDSMFASQIGTPTFRHQHSLTLMWEERVLCCASNCRYTEHEVVAKVWRGWTECGLHSASAPGTASLAQLEERLLCGYIEAKSDPLIGTIEPSMYFSAWEWDTDITPSDLRPYAKEVIANVISVHSQVEKWCRWSVKKVVCEIVETVAEEMSRLLLCVSTAFSERGAMQATLDILALKHALALYTTQQALSFFDEALEAIPPLKPDEQKFVAGLLEKVKSRMSMQLASLQQHSQL